jgi:threonine/homoserine/homoserine lactone efflux protein
VLTVLAAEALAAVLSRNVWVQRGLNWTFAGVFAAFAATILFAEGRK